MLTKTLAGAAALPLMMFAGQALAIQRTGVANAPKQPIPYSQLDAYMKASPKTRAATDWWSSSPTPLTGQRAPTGQATDSATIAAPQPRDDMTVNPTPRGASASMPVTPPVLPADPGKATDPTPATSMTPPTPIPK